MQSSGEPHCEFVFRNANLTPLASVKLRYRRAFYPGRKAVMPWSYHMGHLYATMRHVALDELGPGGGEAIMAGIRVFAQHNGNEAADTILSCGQRDFSELPQ